MPMVASVHAWGRTNLHQSHPAPGEARRRQPACQVSASPSIFSGLRGGPGTDPTTGKHSVPRKCAYKVCTGQAFCGGGLSPCVSFRTSYETAHVCNKTLEILLTTAGLLVW